jgi:hypothetical protein
MLVHRKLERSGEHQGQDMSAGEDRWRADSKAMISDADGHADRRETPRYAYRRAIWFRRRGVLPASGFLLNISERGALTEVTRPADSDVIPWPLHLRHGDELWLYNVVKDPLCCWVVAVEREHIRLRIFNDIDVLAELRALISSLNNEPVGPVRPERDRSGRSDRHTPLSR